jgi:hypothetical protein
MGEAVGMLLTQRFPGCYVAAFMFLVLITRDHLGWGMGPAAALFALVFVGRAIVGILYGKHCETRSRGYLNRLGQPRIRCLARQLVGALPCVRLNARLNASSASYPTWRATAATPRLVVSSRSSARCMRHSVR